MTSEEIRNMAANCGIELANDPMPARAMMKIQSATMFFMAEVAAHLADVSESLKKLTAALESLDTTTGTIKRVGD